MTILHDIHAPDAWTIDLRRQIATHKSGFLLFFTADSSNWQVRRSNADTWVKEDFEIRAPLVPALLRAGLSAYETAYKTSGKKRSR